MEIVVRAVEVGGHHGDVVRAVLQVVTLAHLEARDFGNGVFLVGVFQFAREEAVLAHRLRCVFRVDAGGAEEEQFLHAVGIGFADDVALNLHVHHDEISAVERVGHNAAHKGSGQYDGVGALLVEELADGLLVRQVEFLVCAAHEVGVAALQEVVPDGRAHQSAVACHVYLAVLVHW